MPHSPELIERMLKEAGLFDNVKSWFSGFFGPKPPGSKEQQKALSRADAHFGAKDKDWDKFLSNANRKSFAKAIANDPRADDKLKMHVDNMNRLQTGKQVGSVAGSGTKTYRIIKLRGSDRLGCSCNDWRYKKSVAQPGEQVDCKHIRQFKQMNKTAAHPTYTAQLTSLSPQEQSKLLKEEARKAKKYGRKDFWKDPRYRAEVSLKFPKLFPGKRSWRELTDRDFDKIVRHYRKCRTDRDRYMALRMELGALGLPKDVWRQKVRAVVGTLPVEQMNKTAGHTFSDNGQTYDVEQLWKIDRPGQDVDPEKLLGKLGRTWGDRPNRYGWKDVLAAPDKYPDEVSRVDKADLRYPVLVRDRDDVVVDGIHRLMKARKTGQPVQAIRLSPEDMRAALLKKEAGHVEDRIAERAPGSTYEVAKIKAAIPMMKLRRGQTYHVPLKGGKGYVVIGDVGKKHVVKTVLGPSMRPPGERAKLAMAASEVSDKGLQKGDVVLMTMAPTKHIGRPDSKWTDRQGERIFRAGSSLMQGDYTHAGIYTGKGNIVEARTDGVKKRTLTSALKNLKGAVVVRPKTSKKIRSRAADFAESRVGAAYQTPAFMVGQGMSMLLPKKMESLLKDTQDIEDASRFTCSNLVSAAYVSQGFTPRKDKGEWSLTAPADFLNKEKSTRVKALGEEYSRGASLGRIRGQKTARAPRDYKKEYNEYHSRPEQIANRSLRNQARRKLGLKNGDSREVDHKNPLSKGGSNGKGNLRAVSRTENRRKFDGS